MKTYTKKRLLAERDDAKEEEAMLRGALADHLRIIAQMDEREEHLKKIIGGLDMEMIDRMRATEGLLALIMGHRRHFSPSTLEDVEQLSIRAGCGVLSKYADGESGEGETR